MAEIDKIIRSITERQKNLSPELKSLQEELQATYELNYLESGVIDRGYYTSFTKVLDKYKLFFTKYIISEEEHVDYGVLIKIPIVDIFNNQDNKRIFIFPKIVK